MSKCVAPVHCGIRTELARPCRLPHGVLLSAQQLLLLVHEEPLLLQLVETAGRHLGVQRKGAWSNQRGRGFTRKNTRKWKPY